MRGFFKSIASIILIITFFSCGDNNFQTIEPFDHEAQLLKDEDSIQSFLSKHYFDTTVDSIKKITANQTPLSSDPNLKSITVNEYDIDYKMYYYLIDEGNPTNDKGKPTVMDSVFVRYKGLSLDNTTTLTEFEYRNNPLWFTLTGVIRGWTHGFTNFKNGDNTFNTNGPIRYTNGGRGILIIPSGLAYRNQGTGSGILINSILVFYIELYDFVKDTDHDNDNVPSILEDPDGDGDPRNDDTDNDGIPNYFDSDDDGDGVLTKYEDKNKDGNPANDFNDPNNPTLADYLNFKIRYSTKNP